MTSRMMLIVLGAAMSVIGVITLAGSYDPFMADAEILSTVPSLSAAKSPTGGAAAIHGQKTGPVLGSGSGLEPGPGPLAKSNDPIAQLRELGRLSGQVQELDAQTKAAFKELEAAQLELRRRAAQIESQRRAAKANRDRRWKLAEQRRDALRQAVAQQIATEEKRAQQTARTVVDNQVKQTAPNTAADDGKLAYSRPGSSPDGNKLSAPQLQKTLASKNGIPNFDAAMRHGTVVSNGKIGGSVIDAKALSASLPDRRLAGAASMPVVSSNKSSSHSKLSEDAAWSKSLGRNPTHLRQAMASDAQFLPTVTTAPTTKTVAFDRGTVRGAEKWIESSLDEDAARGTVPTIWNMSSATVGRADAHMGAKQPMLYVSSAGAILVRGVPGELIGRSLVQSLQRELRRIGCAPGRVDGKWGRRGRQALDRFYAHIDTQRVSGDPSAKTLKLLRSKRRIVCRRTGSKDLKIKKRKRISRLGRSDKSIKKRTGKKSAVKSRKKSVRKETWEQQIFGASL